VSPPRNLRSADIESERARQALRALLADPAANFAALPADEFFAALKSACQDEVTHPALLRVVRCERRTSLTVNVDCWHVLPMGIHATLMLAPGCSPWRPKSEPTTSPDAVTDGGGGAGMRRASNRRYRGPPARGRSQSRRPDSGVLGAREPVAGRDRWPGFLRVRPDLCRRFGSASSAKNESGFRLAPASVPARPRRWHGGQGGSGLGEREWDGAGLSTPASLPGRDRRTRGTVSVGRAWVVFAADGLGLVA
jgi:hypothetical protein